MRSGYRYKMRQTEDAKVLLGVRSEQTPAIAQHDSLSQVTTGAGHHVHPLEHQRAPREKVPERTLTPIAQFGAPGVARGAQPRASGTPCPRFADGQGFQNRRETNGAPEIGHRGALRPPHPHRGAIERPTAQTHANARPEAAVHRVRLHGTGPLAGSTVRDEGLLMHPRRRLQCRHA